MKNKLIVLVILLGTCAYSFGMQTYAIASQKELRPRLSSAGFQDFDEAVNISGQLGGTNKTFGQISQVVELKIIEYGKYLGQYGHLSEHAKKNAINTVTQHKSQLISILLKK